MMREIDRAHERNDQALVAPDLGHCQLGIQSAGL